MANTPAAINRTVDTPFLILPAFSPADSNNEDLDCFSLEILNNVC